MKHGNTVQVRIKALVLVFVQFFAGLSMLAHIAFMRLNGKARDQHQIRSAPAVRGNIIVSHENGTLLGRYSDVATVGAG